MSTVLAVLICSALFVVLGLLTRDRAASLRLHGEGGTGRCGACSHPCEESETDDERSR